MTTRLDVSQCVGKNEGHQDYHTPAGFILNLAGEIPCRDAKYAYNGYEFKVVSVEGNQIGRVLIRRL